MTTWKERLEEKRVMIADGGWGTELIKQGLKPSEVAETWNVNRPSEVQSVAASYVKAGADVILTNTFGASPVKLSKAGLGARMDEINRSGARISRDAAGQNAFVFGSMGPTGELMAPFGKLTETEMVKCFIDQAIALAAGGVDGIVIETMSDLGEAKAALRAVREGTSLPAVVSLTFNKHKSGYATLMGNRPDRAVAELEKAGADVVGANCGSGIDDMIELVRLMRRATPLPIWCKPNAGLPEFVAGSTVYRETPERMASVLGAIMEAGARIVGGCCGTTPRHIEALVLERNRLAK